MAFQPLGYRFEIEARRPLSHSKAALRQALVGWFEPKSAPRGWIVGPFLCLWMSAFDRQGPMVFATMRGGDFTTKITGRAGSDLNGTLMFLLLAPVMGWIVYSMILSGQATTRLVVVIGIILGLGLPFTLWTNSSDRKRADPIVRFIERTVSTERRERRAAISAKQLSEHPVAGSELVINGETTIASPSERAVHDALVALETDQFLIVSFGPGTYMQTAKEYDQFVLERRDGNADQHYGVDRGLSLEQVTEILLAYLTCKEADPSLRWKKM